MKLLGRLKKRSSTLIMATFFCFAGYSFLLDRINPVVPEGDLIKSYVDVLYVRYKSPHFVFRENDGRIIKADFLGSLANHRARNVFISSEMRGKRFKKCRGWVEYEKLKTITSKYRLYAISCGDIYISYQKSTRSMGLFFIKYFSHIVFALSGFLLLLAYLYDKRNERTRIRGLMKP